MDAEHPFDSSALADTILRSSDNVDFYVIATILRLMSPIFNDMFSLNKGDAATENESKNKLPVVPFSEDGETLRHLLLVMYPNIQDPVLVDWNLLLKVGRAAQKYCMDMVESKVRESLAKISRSMEWPAEKDLQLYITAVQLGWWSEATVAAYGTLRTPLGSLPYIDQLRDISGTEFHCYLDFRVRCEGLQRNSSGKNTERISRPPIQKSPADLGHQELGNRKTRPRVDSVKPFDSSAEADVILRSSDHVDFFVLEAFIRFASPVFKDMILSNRGLETDKREVKNGLPIIRVDEDHQTLRRLLLLIYPCAEERHSETFEEYAKIGRAVHKYQVIISAAEKLQRQFLASSLVAQQPLRAFAIAVAFQWGEVAKVATKATLKVPLKDLGYVSELEGITGSDLYWLVRYRFGCVEAAWEAIEKDELFANSVDEATKPNAFATQVLEEVRTCPRGTSVNKACNLRVGMLELKLRERASSSTSNSIIQTLKRRNALATAVEEAISKVIQFLLHLLIATKRFVNRFLSILNVVNEVWMRGRHD
ncbi:hypothetical protein AX17_001737 [Amanita inopinata Kibby_2008]|nr:hypothetical protein AX17_001737 [Amanita inopinata Kibby_2008]